MIMMVPNLIFFFLMALVSPSYSCYGGNLMRSGGLTCEEKKAIVDTHNKLRQQVALGMVFGQPSAINMLEMRWDDELARKAQYWANTCQFKHDSQDERQVSRFKVGQNIAWTWSRPRPTSLGSLPDFPKSIQDWFDEVKLYHGTFTSQVGHYTQYYEGEEERYYLYDNDKLVWSDSYLVGCGYAYYANGSQFNKLYVCNYGPGGNIRGTPPYRRGPPTCSLQGTSPSRKFPGLCTVNSLPAGLCG